MIGAGNMANQVHYPSLASLPDVEIAKPAAVISRSTETSIQAGIFYSQIGLIESVVARIEQEIGGAPKVIATGGFAALIAENTKIIDIVDENLLLDGLRMLYSRLVLRHE